MTITTEYRPVDDATLAGILIGGIHEQEEPARIIRLAMDLATDLQSAREEHDRMAAEMDQMRGVVTEAVVALATALVDEQIGHAVRRAAQGESPNPRWHSDATEVYRSVSAVVSVLGVYGGSVALTSPTDGGA